MYQWPTLFPEQTNREDFLKTVSFFDDDTGDALDLSGRTLAAPGDFTAAAWTVTVGNIVTASVTPLTIKDYPFGNEMQAIAPVVGLGLAIAAGNPVTIADATGKNTMTGYVISYAPATGAMVVQVGIAFVLEIRSPRSNAFDGGYGYSSSDIGTYGDAPIIQTQLGNGITVVGLGVVQVRIPASTMQKLHHRTYEVGMAMTDSQDTRQVLLGKQPIQGGQISTNAFAAPSPTSNPFGLP